MVRVELRSEQYERDEVEVGTIRLLVDWALVELGVTWPGLDGVHVNYGHLREEHLVVRFREAVGSSVPSGSVEKQSVDVDTLLTERNKPADSIDILSLY